MKTIQNILRNTTLKKHRGLLCIFWIGMFSFSGVSQNSLETLVTSVSERLQGTITDSVQLYSDAQRAVRLSEQENSEELLATSYHNLATWHQGNRKIDSSVYYLEKANQLYKKLGLEVLQAETHLTLEDTYKQNSAFGKALEEDFKALGIFEKLENQAGIAKTYTRICDLLYYQQKYKEGADYCQKAIDILQPLNMPEELALAHRYKADNFLILGQYKDALSEINTAINVLQEAGKDQNILAPNYNTRGNIYKYMKRYEDAIAEYQKCYNIAKEANDEAALIAPLGNIGHVYRLQEKYEEALPYTLQAIDIMKRSGLNRNLFENYMHASDTYAALGEFEEALKYERLFSGERFKNLQQTISQLESELQIKYETSKKDETIVAQSETIDKQRRTQLLYIGIAILLGIILFGMYFTIKNNRKKRKALAALNAELAQKQTALEQSNSKLKDSLDELKATQAQLIQSEKMASLGELTAGIAHEIQNPLNFVNNFSEVSNELIEEMYEEIDKGDMAETKLIAAALKQNLEKINHHGKRADGIVKGMLQHSRKSTVQKEPTDINKLADEYLRLAYHGLRAKDKSFNATLETNFDETIGTIEVIPQDMGRVILNLITNAFYATNELKNSTVNSEFKPTVSVTTERIPSLEPASGKGVTKEEKASMGSVIISVKDNGKGIPKEMLHKIFQPFFTTKPTGEGTGLGLSMSYDIVKAHGGELKVLSKEGEGTEFIIILPNSD